MNYLWLFIFEEWCKSTGSGSSRPKSMRIHANPDTHGSETLCDTIRYPTNDLLAESGLVITVSGCDYFQKYKNKNTKMETYLEISVPGIVVDVICDLGHATTLCMSSQPQDSTLQGLRQLTNPNTGIFSQCFGSRVTKTGCGHFSKNRSFVLFWWPFRPAWIRIHSPYWIPIQQGPSLIKIQYAIGNWLKYSLERKVQMFR